MASAKFSAEEKRDHIHQWAPDFTERSQHRCTGKDCGWLRISEEEWLHREKEWLAYYELVKTTPAFRDYQAMGEAFKTRNKAAMKEINARIMSRNQEVLNEYGEKVIEPKDPNSLLPKPRYPDPATWNKYFVVFK